jgi:hypothetical protein
MTLGFWIGARCIDLWDVIRPHPLSWEEQAKNIHQCASKGSGLPCTHTCKPNGCLMFSDFPKCARHLSLYVPVLLDAFPDLQRLDFWTWWEIGQFGSKATNASTTYKRPSEKAGIIAWCKWHQNTYFLPGHQMATDLLHGMHPPLALWFLLCSALFFQGEWSNAIKTGFVKFHISKARVKVDNFLSPL